MNVLKTDFISKQKRLQSRRQKVIRTFFSGYHTISNIIPSANCLKIPSTKDIIASSEKSSSPTFPASFSNVERSVEPDFLDTYSGEAEACENGTIDQYPKLYDKKNSTTSTSLEFQKLLEPFLSFRKEDIPTTYEEHFEGDSSDSNSELLTEAKVSTKTKYYESNSQIHADQFVVGNVLPSPKLTREEYLDSVFKNQKPIAIEQYFMWQKSPEKIPQHLLNFNKETFKQFNIFNLPVPKNQKSIEEVLKGKNHPIPGKEISHEVIQSPTSKISFPKTLTEEENNNVKRIVDSSVTALLSRNTPSDMKTPKTKARKSPKVSSSSKTLSSDSGTYILAVTEGRGHARGEVGIAAMDPKRPHLVLCQISDSQRYVHSLTKMNVFDFVEVIVPNTFVDCSTPNKLYSDIRSTFPKVTMTSVQRRHFNESIGIDLIKQYCSVESTSVMVLLQDKFYALSSAAALIKYIEYSQNVRLSPHSLKIEYQGMEDTMIIDLNTANLLELVLCVNHPETNISHNLLGVVNYCHTKGGVRLLRANILQPYCSLVKIETRLDSVTELVNNPLLLCSLEAIVSSFSNLEDLLNLCMHVPQQKDIRAAEYQLKYTLLLKTVLELLPSLRTSLQDAKSQFFCEVRQNLEDSRYSVILKRVLQTVLENAKMAKGSVAAHLHGCFAIKTGVNSLLDVAKKTYCEIVQEISDHVTKLREKHNMPLRLAFSANKGFHIQYTLPPGQKNLTESSLPKEFIFIHKSKTKFSFYTTGLVALDQRSQHVLSEIKLMTNVILCELLTDIRQYVGCLFNLCEYVAEMDVLVAFARVGSARNYVRPKFGDSLDLNDSRHPILDVIHDGEVVPNDAFAAPGKNFTILTGPNQSGKSIYIRQIALLQIMAQIGCYVPAKEATFRLTDRIFSRISFDDCIESNASTLIVEMRDIEYLKQNKTPRSLVIIDELCRGTSVDEGTSLAFAICEELLDTSAFIFFTTHYLFLTKLEDMYFNVTNYHFESRIEISPEGKTSVQFTHFKKKGITKADSYGLKVAEITSLPKDVYLKAKEISAGLSKEKKPQREVNGLLAKYELSLQLKYELLKLESEMKGEEVKSVVKRFQRLYLDLTKKETSEQPTAKRKSVVGNSLSDNFGPIQREHPVGFLLRNSKSKAGKQNSKNKGGKPSDLARPLSKDCSYGIKSSKHIMLKMAKTVRRKYRKLFQRKNRRGRTL